MHEFTRWKITENRNIYARQEISNPQSHSIQTTDPLIPETSNTNFVPWSVCTIDPRKKNHQSNRASAQSHARHRTKQSRSVHSFHPPAHTYTHNAHFSNSLGDPQIKAGRGAANWGEPESPEIRKPQGACAQPPPFWWTRSLGLLLLATAPPPRGCCAFVPLAPSLLSRRVRIQGTSEPPGASLMRAERRALCELDSLKR